MLDAVAPPHPSPGAAALHGEGWPAEGLPWVMETRKSAPGLDSLLRWAFDLGASRIAFSTGKRVTVRVHGVLRFATAERLGEHDLQAIANHLYGADGTARLQNGSAFDVAYEVAVTRTERLRFRLNATPTRTARGFGANIVLRPIADMPASLEDQHVEPGILEACRPKEGVVFVGGAVGSGKSTLIAGMTVAKLLDPHGNYNIVEGAAPVEFLLERIKSRSTIDQTEIPRDLPDFPEFIRGCWRREPTDIVVGECRDQETMVAAVQVAMAGSALTTTVHVNNAALTMPRAVSLLPVGERSNLVDALRQSLRLVINQRLVPSTDGKRTAIREYVVFDAALRRRLRQADPERWEDVVRDALDVQGQSYTTAIHNALDAKRITEETALAELAREEA